MNAPRPDFDRELREMKSPAPPADLASKIKLEIPSSEELVRAAGGGSESPRRTPWLRLAATLAVAGLAGTVAWQTLRMRDAIEPVSEPAALSSRELDDAARPGYVSPPTPPPPSANVSPHSEDRLLKKEEGRSDLAASTAVTPVPAAQSSERGRRVETSAGPIWVEGSSPVQASAVPAPVQKKREPSEMRTEAREVEEGVETGVVGGVKGGVAGGAPGGVVGTVTQPAEVAEILPGRSTYDAVQMDRAPAAAAAKPDRRQNSAGSYRDAEEAPLRVGGRVDSEPQRPDTMIFRDAGVNRFVVTADDALSTFAIDVDTGSYTLARSYIERGTLPPAEAIRLEEFVNAMRYGDAAPRREDFALYAEGSESPYPDAAGLSLLRFAVKAREVEAEARKNANLTFVVDVSGSMDRENRLGLVKRALGLLLDELTPNDRVGLVVYGTEGRILLHPTRDHAAIRAAITELRPEGSTNAEAGLRLGYDLADEAWVQGDINRIILCSDGVANVGATGPESILARIGEQARRGIQLTTVGFGMGNYNDALMERLANQGDGTYHYVDDLGEARKVFVENLTGTLQNVARDAKIQVAFDPRTVERWRLLGYENRDVADRDFRNDAVDAGEVGAGQAATALYEVRLRPGARPGDRVATFQVRWKSVDGRATGGSARPGEVREVARELKVRDIGRSLPRAGRDLRLAAIAASFAEKLKGTRAGQELRWPELAADAAALVDDAPRDTQAAELAALIDRAARLAGEHGRHHRSVEPQADRDRQKGNGRLDEPR